jgi:hypothetical protein
MTRYATTYGEEILRFLHSLPNGVLDNDTVGVTRVVHDEMTKRGFPLTPSSVSSTIANLATNGRIRATFGHRSLDNKHLYTSVTVCAEPKDGVTIGPSEALGHRGDQDESGETETVEALLRRLARRLDDSTKITSEDMVSLQQHVIHLVDENQTWEMLASEAEEELAAERSMLNAERDRLGKDISLQRERAELYRKKWDAERNRIAEAEKSVQAADADLSKLRQELAAAQEKIGAATRSRNTERNRADTLAAERGKDKKMAVSVVRMARRREEHLAETGYFLLVEFFGEIIGILRYNEKHDRKIVISDRALQAIGLIDSSGAQSFSMEVDHDSLREFTRIVGEDSGGTIRNRRVVQSGRSAKSSLTASRLAVVRKELDEAVGPLVAS